MQSYPVHPYPATGGSVFLNSGFVISESDRRHLPR